MNLKTFASLLMLSSTYLFPVIPKVEVWSNGTNYRYLLEDFHCDYPDGRTSIKQHKDILGAAQQLEAKDVFVLAEDTHHYPGTNKKIQNIYELPPLTIEQSITRIQTLHGINSRKATGSVEIAKPPIGPLHCLIIACQAQEIRNYNTECIQAIAVYPGTVTKEEVIDDLKEHIAGLKNHSLLEKDHDHFVQELEQLRAMNLPAIQPSFSKNYIKHILLRKALRLPLPTPAEQKFINKTQEVRANLVNAKTVQKLIEWNTLKHGFVCEGAWHIDSIKPYLKSLGYIPVQSFGNAIPFRCVTAEEEEIILKQAVHQALDLQTTFKQIFAQTAH